MTPTESHRRFYDRISKAYDLLCDASERPARAAGLELLGLRSGEAVLEVGCGTGNELPDLALKVGPTGLVVGLDASGGMLEIARGKVGKAPLPGPVALVLGDARRLPHRSGSFDAVFMSFALELFMPEEMGVVLGEVRRVLRPHGRVGVVAMEKEGPAAGSGLLERGYIWLHEHFPQIIDCRPIELGGVLEGAGFRVARRASFEIWTLPVATAVATVA